ncbi:unnamed protein product [Psylliodes chrysocephalus]|uniref:Uncharacterized protein n=1 Tax=Psylliodes chrysocephalus TaxID=3402493 RepID=A0A9P0CKI1_9CUCU|nr:unnamed protein product [Psylliodes chrysocephala]
MKILPTILLLFLIDLTYQSCISHPGVTTCMEQPLNKNTPLRIENYQNLLEFGQGELQTIPAGSFKLLTELKILFIKNNKVRSIEIGSFDGLYNLEKLSLYNNMLREIPGGVFRDLRNLKQLNLGMNQISTLSDDSFVGLFNLEIINLGFNSLSSIPEALNTIKTLKILTINNNQIKKIPAYSFHNLNKLEILNVADNAITDIQNRAFKGLNAVKDLNLKANYLSTLNTQDILEDMKGLMTVSLAVNSFKCSSLKDIDENLRRRGVVLERGYYNKPGKTTYNGMVCTL